MAFFDASAASARSHGMSERWEYQQVSSPVHEWEHWANHYGREGWEVLAVLFDGNIYQVRSFMKRRQRALDNADREAG
jgi:hypothetical protein